MNGIIQIAYISSDDQKKHCHCLLIAADRFQQNLIKTMMQIEQTYFDLADMSNANCLVICDRGVMDPSACEF